MASQPPPLVTYPSQKSGLYYIILYHIILYYILLYSILLYSILFYYIILYYIIVYYIISYYIILYHIILYYIILYYIILYCIISYHIILYIYINMYTDFFSLKNSGEKLETPGHFVTGWVSRRASESEYQHHIDLELHFFAVFQPGLSWRSFGVGEGSRLRGNKKLLQELQ